MKNCRFFKIQGLIFLSTLEVEYKCIEWHALYDDQNGYSWQIDMIYILNEPIYTGYFENEAERISSDLIQETRDEILRIKMVKVSCQRTSRV